LSARERITRSLESEKRLCRKKRRSRGHWKRSERGQQENTREEEKDVALGASYFSEREETKKA